MKKTLLTLFFAALATMPSLAQKSDLFFWGDPEGYLLAQADSAFRVTERVLQAYPPSPKITDERRLALMQLDVLLHDTTLDTSRPLHEYVIRRAQRVANDLKRPVKGKTIRVYKLYNHGFIVKSRDVTIAFDLYRGFCRWRPEEQLIPDSLMERIVDQCDALFISHRDGDHADPPTVNMFLRRGLPVMAPTNALPDVKGITHVREEQPLQRTVVARGHNLKVYIFPGHQGQKLENNVYMVTLPCGKSVMQTGDQGNEFDSEKFPQWLEGLPRPDVLMVNCFTYLIKEFCNIVQPAFTVTGHEDELGHVMPHREAYWLTLYKLKNLGRPYSVMSWGEWIDR